MILLLYQGALGLGSVGSGRSMFAIAEELPRGEGHPGVEKAVGISDRFLVGSFGMVLIDGD